MRVALVGNPNVGKTTLFNRLTGLRQRVANFPGVTVERKSGRLKGDAQIEIVDLPGTYSLTPRSTDERITYDVLVGRLEEPPDLVVCVVDAGNLARNLFVASQVMDIGLPVIIALTMVDTAESNGLTIDTVQLEADLGVPVIPVLATQEKGVEALRNRLPVPVPLPEARRWPLMDAVAARIPALADQLEREGGVDSERYAFMEVLRTLAEDAALDAWRQRAPDYVQAVEALRSEYEERGVAWRHAEVAGRYAWLGPIEDRACIRAQEAKTRSDRVDAVLTHRIAGPVIFLLLLLCVFQAVFSWATPAMDLVEAGVEGLNELIRQGLSAGLVTDLLTDGVVAGVGNVVIFLPQILLLFLFLGLMEDTGYMARSAFIMDRIMKRVGLSGGSVLPLLSSFACAIPGIMAARTLDNERDRLITIMVAPLMSCSARLPVYTLFIAAFIPSGRFLGVVGNQGLAMFSMYMLGTVMAFVAAGILKRYVIKGSPSSFVMELPPYRRPRLRALLTRMLQRSKVFAVRAGKIIFGCSVALWFLASFPRAGSVESESLEVTGDRTGQVGVVAGGSPEAVAQLTHPAEAQVEQIRYSFIGRFGRWLEPAMQPLGFDWKISAGLVTAFAAREVIISTMGILYSVGDEAEGMVLRDALRADRYPDGRPVFTPLVAVSLLVFFVFALQCMSTLAIARKETGTWRWPAVMWLYMTALAYVASLLVYQGGKLIGFQ